MASVVEDLVSGWDGSDCILVKRPSLLSGARRGFLELGGVTEPVATISRACFDRGICGSLYDHIRRATLLSYNLPSYCNVSSWSDKLAFAWHNFQSSTLSPVEMQALHEG